MPMATFSVAPTGQTQPFVSTTNSDGRVKSVAAIVPAGAAGGMSAFATSATDLVIDINGYFVAATDPTALAFYPVTPCRMADTRNATGALGGPSIAAYTDRVFPLLSANCGIPAGVQAYSLNFTAVPSGVLGWLSAFPGDQSWPGNSTLNSGGVVVANAAIVPADASGQIKVRASNPTDVVVDVNGYFAAPGTGGLSLYNVSPCRVLDTRNPPAAGAFSGTLAVDATANGCGVPASAQAVVANATVVPTAGTLGYLTLWPHAQKQPLVSLLNATDGAVTNNMAIVPTTVGWIDAYATNSTQLILDVFGYFAP